MMRESVLIVALLITLVPATQLRECQLHGEKERGVQLAHVCASIHPLPEEGAPVIMLHGMSDLKETWNGIYENIPLLTHRKVCIYDARNHGDSGWNDTFDVDVLAEDLGNFMDAMNIEKAALVGHSLGGLTVMKFALKNPKKVERLVMEDISPIGVRKEITDAIIGQLKNLLNLVSQIPGDADEDTAKKALADFIRKITNRTEADQLFKKFPLRRRNGAWQWKANLDVFIKAMADFDSFLGKMEGQYTGKALFIYGKASPFKVIDDQEAIRKLFPNAEFFGVEGANHSVHPLFPEFLSELIKFLKLKDKRSSSGDDTC